MAIARQGRLEGPQVIAPVVKFHQELAAKIMAMSGSAWSRRRAVCQALTDKTHAAALLREAAAIIACAACAPCTT